VAIRTYIVSKFLIPRAPKSKQAANIFQLFPSSMGKPSGGILSLTTLHKPCPVNRNSPSHCNAMSC
jgi:hypothetical protein